MYDVVIIGGGVGGYVCAIRASQLGLKVAVVEKHTALGGTCLNVGCIPSKALLHSSKSYIETKNEIANLGINVGKVEFSLSKIMKYKEDTVKSLTAGVKYLMSKNKIDIIKGTAELNEDNSIAVSQIDNKKTKQLVANNVVLAVGSKSSSLKGFDVNEKEVVSNIGALSFKSVPKSLVVIGGGVIGTELGSVWHRLGSNVTVVEYFANILSNFDKDIIKTMTSALLKQGLTLKTSTRAMGYKKSNNKLVIEIQNIKTGKISTIKADKILLSTGRTPNTSVFSNQVKLDKHGFIEVDSQYATSRKNVFAIGDCIRGPMLAHKAEEEGICCAEIIAGQKSQVNYHSIPSIVYTSPEVASVGLNELQAKKMGLDISIGKAFFKANARARINGITDGFVKIITDKNNDKILGCHIVNEEAGELIGQIVLAMEFGASAEDIARANFAHPTVSETIKEAALSVAKRTINE